MPLPVSHLVVCPSVLWKDLLLCVPLPCWRVGGAQDPARDQLKTFSEALTPRVPASGAWSAMAFRRTEGMSMIQALAMTVAEIPVFLYTTFGQVRWVWSCSGVLSTWES